MELHGQRRDEGGDEVGLEEDQEGCGGENPKQGFAVDGWIGCGDGLGHAGELDLDLR